MRPYAPQLFRLADDGSIQKGVKAHIGGKWVAARPLGMAGRQWRIRFRIAWKVFKGEADAFTWPHGQ